MLRSAGLRCGEPGPVAEGPSTSGQRQALGEQFNVWVMSICQTLANSYLIVNISL